MAVTGHTYGEYIKDLQTEVHNVTSDVLKMALLDNGYTINVDTHTQWSDCSGDEISGGNYVQKTLASVTLTKNTGTKKIELDCADVTWTNLTGTFRWVIVFNDTATNDELLTAYDLGADQTVSGVDFVATIASDGLHTTTYSL